MYLDVKYKKIRDGYVFIDVAGDMDAYTSRKFKCVAEDLITQKKHNLIVDMEKVTYLDSMGARGLLNILSKTREKNGDTWLIYNKSPVKRFLGITGLGKKFTTFQTSYQAFAKINCMPNWG